MLDFVETYVPTMIDEDQELVQFYRQQWGQDHEFEEPNEHEIEREDIEETETPRTGDETVQDLFGTKEIFVFYLLYQQQGFSKADSITFYNSSTITGWIEQNFQRISLY